MKQTKIISFSLWGNNPKYTVGALKNAELARRHYPDWMCRFYVGTSVPTNIIEQLRDFDNTEVLEMGVPGNWQSMYWRFYPASDDDVDIMISRDCDSRLNAREAQAVKEFEESDKTFHTMRDHPAHRISILGGMWGAKKGTIPNMVELINEHITEENRWGIDQVFLCKIIAPIVRPNWIQHDSFYNIAKRKTDKYCRAFPSPRDKKTMRYIGEPFNHMDKSEIILTKVGHN